MTELHASSLRRRITSTWIRTLALLLLTNVFWSVWAAWIIVEPRDIWFWDARWGGKQLAMNRVALINMVSKGSRTHHSVVILSPDLAQRVDRPFAVSFEEIAPPWIERWLSAKQKLPEIEPHEQWDFEAVGWPARMLWTGWMRSGGMNTQPVPLTGLQVVEARRGWGPGYVLPIRPILVGQALTAAFWLGVLCITPVARRRWRLGPGSTRALNSERGDD